jgi:lipopolysaccharide export LptBFGC system permease protein LptF
MKQRSRTGAVILIFIGAIFLLINLGVLPVAELRVLLAKWWPLILIAIGAWLLMRPRKGEQ